MVRLLFSLRSNLSSEVLTTGSKVYIGTGAGGLFCSLAAHSILKVLDIDFYIQVLTTLTLEVLQLPSLFFYVLSVGWVCNLLPT